MNGIKPKRRVRRRGSKGKPLTKAELADLRAQREEFHIELRDIAAEAAKTARFGTMGVSTVSSVLHGDARSQNVIDALRRLIAHAREQKDREAVA